MSKICQICGGLIFAGSEVMGYAGPVCTGHHNQATVVVLPAPSLSENNAQGQASPEEWNKQLEELLGRVLDNGVEASNKPMRDYTGFRKGVTETAAAQITALKDAEVERAEKRYFDSVLRARAKSDPNLTAKEWADRHFAKPDYQAEQRLRAKEPK